MSTKKRDYSELRAKAEDCLENLFHPRMEALASKLVDLSKVARPGLIVDLLDELDEYRAAEPTAQAQPCNVCGGGGYVQTVPGVTEDCPHCNTFPPDAQAQPALQSGYIETVGDPVPLPATAEPAQGEWEAPDEHPCYTCGEIMAFDDFQASDCGNEECQIQHILNWHRERVATARREERERCVRDILLRTRTNNIKAIGYDYGVRDAITAIGGRDGHA